MEKINCPICDNSEFDFLFKSKDNIHNIRGYFDIVSCTKCSFVLTNPRPDKKEIIKYYPEDYQPYSLNYGRSNLVLWLRKIFGSIAYFFYNETIILKPKTTKKPPNILEIGCGGGNFLYEYKHTYPSHNLIGLDSNELVVNKLKKRKFNVIHSDMSRIQLDTASIDYIYGWMALEHIHDINLALGEISRILKKDGRFVFSIPNAKCFQFSLFKENFYPTHIPVHLYHFTPKSIEKILKRHGIKVEKILYQKTARDLFESIKILCREKRYNNLLKVIPDWNLFIFVLLYPVAISFSLFRQSSRVTVIAKKYE